MVNRILIVVAFLSLTVYVAVLSVKDWDKEVEEEGGLKKFLSLVPSRYFFWGVLVFLLLGAAGWVITEFDALDEKRARQEASEIRSQALQAVYSLENGERIPRDLALYSDRRQVDSILPGGARGEEIIDLDISPGTEVFLKGEIVGDSWELNCAQLPIGRLRSYTSGGTSHGNDRLIQFKKDGTFWVETQLVHGGRPGLTVGCPGHSEWIKLDYKIVEKRRVS